MDRCSTCRSTLNETLVGRIGVHSCPECQVELAYSAAIATQLSPNFWLELASEPQRAGITHHRCPGCARRLVGSASSGLLLCGACGIVASEGDGLQKAMEDSKSYPSERPPNPAAAVAALQAAARHQDAPPTDPLGRVLYYVGLPVEQGQDPLVRRPYVVWALLLLCLGTSIRWYMAGEPIAWAFDPRAPTFATFFVSGVLHASPLHLLGNFYGLAVFGDDVESRMGPLKFVLLVLTAHFATLATFSLVSAIPGTGASGYVFAVLVYYALRFRYVRFHHFVYFHGRTGHYVLSVRQLVGFYLVIQLFLLFGQGMAVALAHLAGAFVGFAFWKAETLGTERRADRLGGAPRG